MLFRNIFNFATSKGKLILNKGKNAISGNLEMTIINSSDGTKYPVTLNIYSEYHSGEDFVIPPVYFDDGPFNILSQNEFRSINDWWFKCRQINSYMLFELWARIPGDTS